jgi:hypothetical protein
VTSFGLPGELHRAGDDAIKACKRVISEQNKKKKKQPFEQHTRSKSLREEDTVHPEQHRA